ncbi:hypothetical protein GCM10007939_09910 [Amylibacter marinus]|uniref:DUF1223 domain-containing protein n=1 Tax=Amylibacter marinus TaxID=1475483 RepID=A0ABQ5VUC7_9RHOB|nr:DUF1223 domain-containing protein [Amylibacter marinus]GLQ34708.1 hypothetical protein GCM10007939_09910 [Amylibacter marinus]
MNFFKTLASAAVLATATAAQADDTMIVVELFTSQGCSSCPPADEILRKLSKHDDVIALSMHVDYWDYLGWKDQFAIAKFGERQARYNAQIIKRSRRVTPQMIFNGVAEVAGGSGRSVSRINQAVKALRNQHEAADVSWTQKGNTIKVSLASNAGELGRAVLNLVEYSPMETVKIKRGENAGRTISYVNTVKSFTRVGNWDGKSNSTVSFDLPKTGDYALIVQGYNAGPVFAARKLAGSGS